MHVIIVQQIKKKFCVTHYSIMIQIIVTCLPIKCEHDKFVFDPLVYEKLSPKKFKRLDYQINNLKPKIQKYVHMHHVLHSKKMSLR